MLAHRLRFALLAGALVASAAHASPTLPTRALEKTLREERAAGMTRSEPLASALLHMADRVPDRRARLLNLASQADPALVAPHFAQAREALSHGDVPLVGTELAAGFRAVRHDAREEAVWLRRAVRALHAWLRATLATLAVLFALRAAPLSQHALGARLGSRAAAAVVLVAPIVGAFAASTALGILATALVAMPFMRRRERVCA